MPITGTDTLFKDPDFGVSQTWGPAPCNLAELICLAPK